MNGSKMTTSIWLRRIVSLSVFHYPVVEFDRPSIFARQAYWHVMAAIDK